LRTSFDSNVGPSLRRILGEDTTRLISGPEQEVREFFVVFALILTKILR
jgi:hypothetical protein